MLTKYKIIRVYEQDHSITVRFYTDIITEEVLAIRNPDTNEILLNADGSIQSCRTDYNITLWKVPTLTEEELDLEIQKHAPIQWLELQENIIKSAVDNNMLHIRNKLNIENVLITTRVESIKKPELTEAQLLVLIDSFGPQPTATS